MQPSPQFTDSHRLTHCPESLLAKLGYPARRIRQIKHRVIDRVIDRKSEWWFAIGELPRPIQDRLKAEQVGEERVALTSLVVSSVSVSVKAVAESKLPLERAMDVALGDAWMRFLDAADPEAIGYPDRPALYAAAAQEMREAGVKCVAATSGEWLRKRLAAWRKEGWRSLVSKKIGMRNHLKVTPEAVEVLKAIYSDPRQFGIAETRRIYLEVRRDSRPELPELSETAVRSVITKPEIMNACLRTRVSDAEWRGELDPVTHRRRPSHPDDLWVLDGTVFELYWFDGKTIHRLYWVWVLDAATWKVVGYAFGDRETGHLVRQALRMAVRNTGSIPHQLQFDNSSAFKAAETMEWMSRLGKLTPAQVGNARAKVAEPFWAHFQREVLKYLPNHSGGNVKAKRRDTHANADFIAANYKSFPDRAGVERQAHEAVARWNASAHGGIVPDVAYAKGSPRRRELSLEEATRLFWVRRPKTVTYTNRGLRLEIERNEHWYEAGDTPEEAAAFYLDHAGQSFEVWTDPDDPSEVALHMPGGAFVAMAREARLVPMALADREDGDGEAIAKRERTRKAVRDLANQRKVTPEAAEAALKGAISYERIQKDAANDAEGTLKRMAAIGVLEPLDEEPEPVRVPVRLFAPKADLGYLED